VFWPPSPLWILKFLTFWFSIRLRLLRCIIIPNFIKIDRTAAQISHLTFFKMAAVRHLGFFLKLTFWKLLRVQKANMYQHAKCRPNLTNRCWNIAIYPFLARDVIYISRLCHDASPSVSLSVCLSVTEVHGRIIANIGFQFRSYFTAHWPPCCWRALCCLLANHLAPC